MKAARLGRDAALIYAAAFLRSATVGLVGVVLAIYLSESGFSATLIGTVIGSGLAGAAVATLLVSVRGDAFGRRRTLIALAVLSAVGYVALAAASHLVVLMPAAFFGMLNGMGRDRGAASALDQAILPETAVPERRTWVLAWYNVVLDGGHAIGALAGATPTLLIRAWHATPATAHRTTFLICAVATAISILPYVALTPRIEVTNPAISRSKSARKRLRPSGGAGVPTAAAALGWRERVFEHRSASERGPQRGSRAGVPERGWGPASMGLDPHTRRVVTRLAVLFGLDSIGGGFLNSALIAYWFFRRYGTSEGELAVLFFVARTLNATSHVMAAWVARRIGLVNTMVLTHLPSSLFLMAVPAAPTVAVAGALFLAREALVEMDVPTRQSYVMAIVQPSERTFASGVTNVTRNVAWALGPSLAGIVMQHVALAGPLFIGGTLKIAYDLMLYGSFRNVKAPEEQGDDR